MATIRIFAVYSGLFLAVASYGSSYAASPPVKPAAPPAKAAPPPGTIPDLVVSDLFIVIASNEVRFKVKNVGNAEKAPGRINYDLTATYFGGSGGVTSTRNFTAIAAFTSLSRLPPNQETAEDRVTGQNIAITGKMNLRLCINRDAQVAESNYANNCLSRTAAELFPDLAVTGGRLNLYKPPEDDPWYEDVGEFIWDTITFSHEFDHLSLPMDHVQVTFRNNGVLPLVNFTVGVGVWKGDSLVKTYKTTYKETLAPGQVRHARVYLGLDKSRWRDKSCCKVTAMVDEDDKITETNEDNNKMALPTVRVREH